jgi:hypothetical protein
MVRYGCQIKRPPRCAGKLTPRGPRQQEVLAPVTTPTIRPEGEKVAAELRVLEERYRHEILGVEERDELRERILRLRRKLSR